MTRRQRREHEKQVQLCQQEISRRLSRIDNLVNGAGCYLGDLAYMGFVEAAEQERRRLMYHQRMITKSYRRQYDLSFR